MPDPLEELKKRVAEKNRQKGLGLIFIVLVSIAIWSLVIWMLYDYF